jgi:hypothetical protein
MSQIIYTISAAPMFPDGKTGFWRDIGEGFTLAGALADAEIWADGFNPADHSEPCESCGGHESDECSSEHCEGGREVPDALDLTAAWREYDESDQGEKLATWRKDRRGLLANRMRNAGYKVEGDALANGADAQALLDRIIETMGEQEQEELLPIAKVAAEQL